MKFTLEIELGNEAMRTAGHVSAAIEDVAYNLFRQSFVVAQTHKIRDINGNTVGKWEVVDETACAVCGVSAPEHGHYDVMDTKTHKWVSPARR